MNIAFDMSLMLGSSTDPRLLEGVEKFIHHVKRSNPDDVYHFFYEKTDSRHVSLPDQIRQFIEEHHIHCFHVFDLPGSDQALWRKEWFGKSKVVLYVQHMLSERFVSTSHVRNDSATESSAAYLNFLQSCDLILAASSSVREDAIQYAGAPAEKVKLATEVNYQQDLRKRLAVFTPMTASDSDLNHYIQLVLPALQERYECDVFIGDGYEPHSSLNSEEPAYRIFRHAEFVNRAQLYDDVMFQLGDSTEHKYMVPYVLRYPGIVVLHDLELRKLGLYEVDYYLEKARAIIVHSRRAKKILHDKGFHNVGYIRLPQKLPVMISLVTARNFVFSSFIQSEEHAWVVSAIRMVKRLVDEGNTDIRYVVYGPYAAQAGESLRELVKELGLDNIIEFKACTDRKGYQTALSLSDACIHMFDDHDAASPAAVLDILAYGKAAIVRDSDMIEELPDEVVCKIGSDGQWEEQLYVSMQKLYRDKGLRQQMRQKTRKYISEKHTLPNYIDKFQGIVEDGLFNELDEVFDENGSQAQPEHSNEESSHEAERDSETATEASSHDNHSDQESDSAKASETIARVTTRSVYLTPNRYRRLLLKTGPVSYFSFNLGELPPDCTIERAVMQIQAVTKVLRIHRIKSPWSSRSAVRRRPSIRALPIYKTAAKPKSKRVTRKLFTWECTSLAQSWMQDQLSNHGVYVPRVSALKKPRLHVVISGKFDS
ncbi:hypothetical protein [Paenibacillus hexagrammi]|uniref:Glycosyltransferase n=1 Tax=Paenibacillus hexagrammi TaxID=2908839 RepID=A0ABY3SG98_9BACL|nr:hypothetical protein [Paenibacillus sp. YPD9-1]UJF32110.1 hypothetical protein L0M14_20580 [Paenibacillus sp. YPD9-1]